MTRRRRNMLPSVTFLLQLLLLIFADCRASIDARPPPRPGLDAGRTLPSPATSARGGGASLPALPPWSHKVLAGGVSRAAAQALLYPVDALRTLAQTRDGRTLADVGAAVLVKGCGQTSSFALVTGAIQFGVFGAVRPRCGPLVASACGAAGSCLVSVPQEVIKQRLVTGVYGSFREAVATIWTAEGVRGFYSAWRPTAARNVPFVVAAFTASDALRRRLRARRARAAAAAGTAPSAPTALEDAGLGVGAALLACVLTQPLDVVKTRMMTQAASAAVPYGSALECAGSVLRTEGWRTLYRGIGPRGVYMCGLWGITFGLEPAVTRYLKERGGR